MHATKHMETNHASPDSRVSWGLLLVFDPTLKLMRIRSKAEAVHWEFIVASRHRLAVSRSHEVVDTIGENFVEMGEHYCFVVIWVQEVQDVRGKVFRPSSFPCFQKVHCHDQQAKGRISRR